MQRRKERKGLIIFGGSMAKNKKTSLRPSRLCGWLTFTLKPLI
jgi:hypothetical protein